MFEAIEQTEDRKFIHAKKTSNAIKCKVKFKQINKKGEMLRFA